MAITEPWPNPADEYSVLVDVIVPAAQAQYDQALNDWNALDAKAFGFLAVIAAVVAGLAAAHENFHKAWWGAALGCAIAGGFFVASLWPKQFDVGPDLVDLHDEGRRGAPLDTARVMLDQTVSAQESVESGYQLKSNYFSVGLALLAVSLVACLPILAFRP